MAKKKNPHRRGKSSEAKRIRDRKDFAAQADGNLAVLPKVMALGGFLSASIRPSVRDSEIIVCFADIRGFTEYCKRLQEDSHDRKIQNFLQQYFAIFVEGMVLWRTSWDVHESKGFVKAEMHAVKQYMSPTMFKNLGDGMMIVWEIPPGLSGLVEGQITREVIDVVTCFENRFYRHFRNLSDVEKDSYSEMVTSLEIGFAVARGHAWRLEFSHGVDYAGSVVNLTSRLLDYARPRGVVVQYLMSQALFDERVAKGEGRLATISGLKGFKQGIQVWMDAHVDSTQSGITGV